MSKRKTTPQKLDEKAIGEIVTAETDDDSAWDPPVQVKRPNAASVSIPAELAARAALLAGLLGERGIDTWIERILRERVEIEELACNETKSGAAAEPANCGPAPEFTLQ